MSAALSPEELAARQAEALKSIETVNGGPGPQKDSAAENDDAEASKPAESKALPSAEPADRATDPTDAAATPSRDAKAAARLLELQLEVVLSNAVPALRDVLRRLLREDIRLSDNGAPEIASTGKPLDWDSVREWLGGAADHFAPAKGFGGSGVRGSREVRSSPKTRESWRGSQKDFEKNLESIRAKVRGEE